MPADDYDSAADMRASVEWAYTYIRARVAAGGRGWRGYGQQKRAPEGALEMIDESSTVSVISAWAADKH